MAPTARGNRRTRHAATPSDPAPLPLTALEGRIKWLPDEDEIEPTLKSPGLTGCYDHPVVVLSSRPCANGKVVILTMTSFGGKDLNKRFPRNDRNMTIRARHLPIKPSKPHPDNGILLQLAPHCRRDLNKESYIKIEKQITVYLGILRDYSSRHVDSEYVLSAESYSILIRRCGFTRDPRAIVLAADPPRQSSFPPLPPPAPVPAVYKPRYGGSGGSGGYMYSSHARYQPVATTERSLVDHGAGPRRSGSGSGYGYGTISAPVTRPPQQQTVVLPRYNEPLSSQYQNDTDISTAELACSLFACILMLVIFLSMAVGVYFGAVKFVALAKMAYEWARSHWGELMGRAVGLRLVS